MSEQKKISADDTKARWLQKLANGLSISRTVAGPALAVYIAKSREYRTVPTVATIGIVAATDYFDGRLARKAKVHRTDQQGSERGAWLDQMADKAFVHSLMGGMAVHAAKQGDKAQAGILLANQAVQFARDTWVTQIRSEAQDHGVPTGARWLGRLKTATTLAALTAKALPPMARYETAQTWTAIAGVTAGTALSIVSGVSLVSELRNQIEGSPDTGLPEFLEISGQVARIALDDTSQAL